MPYVTKTEIKQYHGITWNVSLDTFIDTLEAAAVKYIERLTGRTFVAPDPDTATTRYYSGSDSTSVKIDDLRELTSLVVDGVTLTVDEDFYLSPSNAESDGKPYTRIDLIQPETRLNANPRLQNAAPYIFQRAQRNIVVTGKWGYSATAPEDVKVAVLKVVGSFIKENIGDDDLREVKSETLDAYSVSYESISKIAHALNVEQLLGDYIKQKNAGLGGVIRVS